MMIAVGILNEKLQIFLNNWTVHSLVSDVMER